MLLPNSTEHGGFFPQTRRVRAPRKTKTMDGFEDGLRGPKGLTQKIFGMKMIEFGSFLSVVFSIRRVAVHLRYCKKTWRMCFFLCFFFEKQENEYSNLRNVLFLFYDMAYVSGCFASSTPTPSQPHKL